MHTARRTVPLLFLAALVSACQMADVETSLPEPHSPGSPSLAGPFVHENLALFLVRGGDTDDRDYVTLDEGLSAGVVKVREVEGGADVNTLSVANASSRWLFLHAGDIVQGGQQDRTIATDALIPPYSTPQPIDAFCVEPDRWFTDGPSGTGFRKNTGIVAGNALKLSIQKAQDQGQVWDQVAAYETEAARKVGFASGMASPAPGRLSSTGTYNAIVENEQISRLRRAYVEALLPKVQNEEGVVGLLVAVNGEMAAADVYASSSLFRKLAPKLIDSFALQAVLSRSSDGPRGVPTVEAATRFLREPRVAQGQEQTVGSSLYRRTRETDDAVLFEYGRVEGKSEPGAPALHMSYVRKGDGRR